MPNARNMKLRKTRISLEAGSLEEGEGWDTWTISYDAPACERVAILRELQAANENGHFEMHLDFGPGQMQKTFPPSAF